MFQTYYRPQGKMQAYLLSQQEQEHIIEVSFICLFSNLLKEPSLAT